MGNKSSKPPSLPRQPLPPPLPPRPLIRSNPISNCANDEAIERWFNAWRSKLLLDERLNLLKIYMELDEVGKKQFRMQKCIEQNSIIPTHKSRSTRYRSALGDIKEFGHRRKRKRSKRKRSKRKRSKRKRSKRKRSKRKRSRLLRLR